ncbi:MULTISPECIES: baseplate J/gp47 family protein [unclassified Pseudomonas]|uniref:baseplate J/gp47 family protein n=1 Tax=unclassified Pseudomonas TaxID=196821 RepID=UPI0015A4AAE3|nr:MULTISPECIES: baseplate J/gp47 family protein [unclassified Pseudomonas]NWC92613.1 baseplate J/gp47 family protein [Pseudomonas sp. IPO3779]NWD15610.1 baseplate J/gp47 family protein [Pseudomonas sp. IPO3778]
MPYTRPTLTDLRANVAADITSGLPTADGLLRFSNLQITGKAVAGLAYLNYGYLDWIAKQGVPYTASGEYLYAWGAMKNVYPKPPTVAAGAVTFPGTPGVIVSAGTQVVRSDSETFTTQASATVSPGGTLVVAVVADLAGEAGNTPVGGLMTLGTSVTGVQSTGAVTAVITGGADQEEDEAFFGRMLAAYQSTPNGGSHSDYVTWAESVSGVTRAWCMPNGFGAGTVVVYSMLDDANAAYGGFPQGTNGISSSDNRATSGNLAAGDQLIIANSVYIQQPVTAMVYHCAPIAAPIAFTITGLTGASTAIRAAVAAAVSGVLFDQGAPLADGSSVDISDVGAAISAIAGTQGFVITSPVANIPNTLGHLPTLGTITYG